MNKVIKFELILYELTSVKSFPSVSLTLSPEVTVMCPIFIIFYFPTKWADTPRLPDQRLLAAATVTAAKPSQNFEMESSALSFFFLFFFRFFFICLNSAWTQRCIKTISPRRQINAEKRIITNNSVDKTFGAQSEAEIDPQTSGWPFPDSACGASVNFFFVSC